MKSRLRPIPTPACLVLAFATSACMSDVPPAPTTSAGGPIPSMVGSAAAIPQPEPPAGLVLADEGERVDLAVPTFTNPTEITNPLFPVSSQRSVLLLGTVDDQAFRTEVTLLPTPRIIAWEGQQVATLVSQYVAFLDGRIHEVAYDLYAQADDGSVWYFGEDVFNFADGAIVDTHGTWTAGIDGPAAMIMPARPQVGDAYRPENIPGFVFEEVTVSAIDETLDGPFGPIDGGLLIQELHMDGATEEKTFAQGYGEFYTAGGGDVEALALAVPTDEGNGEAPAALGALTSSALDVQAAAASENWEAVAAAVEQVTATRGDLADAEVPRLVGPLLDNAIATLQSSLDDRDGAGAGQAAIETARLALDMELRFRSPGDVDVARFDLWLAQIDLDSAAEDGARVNGDYFALDYIRDRILDRVGPAEMTNITVALEEMLGAVQDEDYEAVAEIASEMRETIAGIAP